MNTIEQLLALARSPRPDVRADAGRWLAAHVGDPRADVALIQLIQDPDDTLPTLETTSALLLRRDDAGVRLLALALSNADEDAITHCLDALWEATATESEFDALRARVERVALDPDPSVQTGARTLLAWFARG
ncbi:MAG: hypothetical protein AB7I24_13085 [Candidatus Nanopelagicales bacterium]